MLIYVPTYISGILAKIAKVSLRNYRDDVFTNYIGSEKVSWSS